MTTTAPHTLDTNTAAHPVNGAGTGFQVPPGEGPVGVHNGSVGGQDQLSTAPPAAAATAPVLSAAEVKQHEKEHKHLEKQLHKEEVKEEKQVKQAIKGTAQQAKEEKKAAKAETKSRKLVEKYTAKEAKYAKGVAAAQLKHDKMVTALNKAKQDLEIHTQHRLQVVNARNPAQQQLEQTQAAKAAHDAQRKAALEADVIPTAHA